MEQRKGFTLIELLVVIAIIAILAAILFPVFTAVRLKGQQAACLNNMKQLGTAVYTYLSDWNETYPMNRYQDPLMPVGEKMDGSRFNWKTAVYPYVKNRTGVWRCVFNVYSKRNLTGSGSDETGKAVNVPCQKFPISYAFNGDYFNDFNSNFVLAKKTMGQIPTPTRLLFIIETRFDAPDLQSSMLEYAVRQGPASNQSWMTIHYSKVSNFLFADLHSKAMKVQNTLTPKTMWVPQVLGADQAKYTTLARKLAPECYE